MVGMKKGLALS